MGKRKFSTQRSPQEIKQDMDLYYDRYIKDSKSGSKLLPVRHTAAEKSDLILRDPGANDARRCYECECTGANGACDNYLLYAGLRQMCKKPVEVTV
jgi:hypothetical protein